MAEIKQLNKEAKKHSERIKTSLEEVQHVIVGQDSVLRKLIISLMADGNVLLEGVPGLAKTLMIRTVSDTLQARFSRIQFTPDLLPADIIGTKIYKHKEGTFTTKKGPIFANFILADEINRAPPKVQSALLEAMQERQVTISGDTFELKRPFLVLATQNPVETEGTYSLPEAQVDRFMFKVLIDYPSRDEEKTIIDRMTQNDEPQVKKTLHPDEILDIQRFVRSVYCDEKISDYVVRIVEASRKPDEFSIKPEYIDYGASPRASIWMILGAKAHAVLEGRGYCIPEDVWAVAYEVLRHRILLSYEAEAEDITSDTIIKWILDTVTVP